MKRFSTQVFFTALNNIPHVSPPFVAGKRDSMWVTTLSNNPDHISKEAIHKAEACYGLRISDISMENQFTL